MSESKEIKKIREMLNEWNSHPLVELSIGVLVRHPLPWTVEKGYPGGYYITASDGVDVAINVSEKTAYGLVLWAQEVVKAGEKSSEKYGHVKTTNMEERK